ncbi:MAG: hypothetical protein LQ340_001519 [Diploschistes diacapsis]|nr:MAG: hypothetical protein LQ340_001519 [Diploschistes diacapsis]
MPEQHVLQAALSSGLSATEGIHNKKTNGVDPSFDGLAIAIPQDFVPNASSRVIFKGKHSNVEMPYLSWGAWSWGDKATWHWSPEELPALKEAWKMVVEAGQGWIDTAQAYGSGESERIIGDLIKGLPRNSYQIQTKWYVVPDNATNLFSPSKAPAKMLRESLDRMGIDQIDSYLVHGPIHVSSIKQVAKGLAECVESGMTKTVGVANYSEEDMIHMADELSKYGIPLATNQCEFSILRRLPETSDLLRACRERGIHFQSYSSLAQGRLSGKYDAENEPPKSYRFSSYPMKDLEPTLAVLKSIAARREKPVSAVALNYNICKGILPVVGIRKSKQAKDNLAALGWRLTNDEIKELDGVSLEGKATKLWQQG